MLLTPHGPCFRLLWLPVSHSPGENELLYVSYYCDLSLPPVCRHNVPSETETNKLWWQAEEHSYLICENKFYLLWWMLFFPGKVYLREGDGPNTPCAAAWETIKHSWAWKKGGKKNNRRGMLSHLNPLTGQQILVMDLSKSKITKEMNEWVSEWMNEWMCSAFFLRYISHHELRALHAHLHSSFFSVMM